MDNIILDSYPVLIKTTMACTILTNIQYKLEEFDSKYKKAYREINSHNELSTVYYSSLDNYIDDIKNTYKKYYNFGGNYNDSSGGFVSYIDNMFGGLDTYEENTQKYTGSYFTNANKYHENNSLNDFGILNNYYCMVDMPYRNYREKLYDKLQQCDISKIMIENNIGVVESTPATYGFTVIPGGVTQEKQEININDLFNLSSVNTILKSEYEDWKKLIEELNLPNEDGINNYTDYINAIVNGGDYEYTPTYKSFTSFLLDCTPIALVKMPVEGLIGKDIITGEELSSLERTLFLLPLVGKGISIVRKSIISELAASEISSGVTLSMNGSGKFKDIIRVYKGIDDDKLYALYDIVTKKKTFKKMSIALSNDLVIEMPYLGKSASNTNAAGYLRDSNYYFKELYKKHPEYFSSKNIYNLENGYNIVNDATFRKYFPEYDVTGLRGNKLIHHHIGGGGQAAAIPEGIHPGCGGIHNNEKELGIWYNGID